MKWLGSSARAEMRLAGSLLVSARIWFLRSRGDAPLVITRHRPLVEVPPLARRCASRLVLRRRDYVGSSARAEMRLTLAPWCSRPMWFLRSRGDAPYGEGYDLTREGVPPLARRCAAFGGRDRVDVEGSSARAEMRRPHHSPW